MQVTLDGSQERVFMIMNKFKAWKIREIGSIVSLCLWLSSCEPDLQDHDIPIITFPPLTINVNLPEYQQLRSNGVQEISGVGIKGVILYRLHESRYFAYERNCSFQPHDACAVVSLDPSNLFMRDACCNSTFDFQTGSPTGGPAWRPLRKYETTVNGSIITITSNIVD